MNFNGYFFRLAILGIAAASLISCSANEDADTCSTHHITHPRHIDKVVQVEMDYSTSNRLNVSTSVPLQLSNESNRALLINSKDVIQVNAKGSCQHNPVSITESDDRIVYHYLIQCGDENEIDHIETRILDVLPELSEIDVSVSSPAATKNFVLHRDCSTPIYKYL